MIGMMFSITFFLTTAVINLLLACAMTASAISISSATSLTGLVRKDDSLISCDGEVVKEIKILFTCKD